MFKAKLIDGENYYSLRRKNLVFFFVTSVIGGALWGLGMASAYVIASSYVFRFFCKNRVLLIMYLPILVKDIDFAL